MNKEQKPARRPAATGGDLPRLRAPKAQKHTPNHKIFACGATNFHTIASYSNKTALQYDSECLIVALVEAKFLREISTLLELNRETDGWGIPLKPYVNKSFSDDF